MLRPVTVLLRDHTTGDQPVSSLAQILKPDKSQLKRVLKWIVIANAVLAAVGIVVGGNPDFVARVHGTSFLLVVTAASLVAIEQGKFRTEIKYVWPVGSACSTAIGVVVIALIWGFEPPEAIGRPVGSVAVAAVASTPTVPVVVFTTAGLTAGSIPMKGVLGNVSLRLWSAAADAVLQATAISFAPSEHSHLVICMANDRISTRVRVP